MIHYLLESSLVSIVCISFYCVALNGKSFHQWNRIYLLLSLIASLVIPAIHIPIEDIIYVQNISTITHAAAFSPKFWPLLLQTIYISGVLVSLFFLCTEIIHIQRIIALATKSHFAEYTLAEIEQKFPLSSFFNVILIQKDKSISAFELEHELSHIRQKHSYDKVFMEVAKSIFWFNPVIYLYRKKLHEVHEFLADDATVSTYSKESYLTYLIDSIKSQHIFPATVNPFHSLIKKRLLMLNNKKESTKRLFILVIPILLILTLFISCEKKTKLVSVSADEDSHLEFNKDGDVIVSDTIIVFDDQTLEESTRIATGSMSLDRYLSLQPVKNATQLESIAKNTDSNVNFITVHDTVIVFNDEIKQEAMEIIKTKMTEEEYQERLEEMERLAAAWEPFWEKKTK